MSGKPEPMFHPAHAGYVEASASCSTITTSPGSIPHTRATLKPLCYAVSSRGVEFHPAHAGYVEAGPGITNLVTAVFHPAHAGYVEAGRSMN